MMDETLELETAGEAVLETREDRAPADADADAQPKAYVFDGWGMTPLEF